MKNTFSMVAVLATLLLSTLTANGAEPIVIADGAAVAVASVVSVDEKTRVVTLAGPDGEHSTFTAGPEVKNFAQIKRGDRVIASYFSGFAMGIGPKGSGVKDRLDSMEVSTAKKGAKPGLKVSNTTVAIGVVKDVDAASRVVTLEGVENTLVLKVADDVDLSGVNAGDSVEAVYTAGYAINFIPAPEVSGTVTLESTSVAIGIGVTWGHGVFTMHDGSTHKFKVKGLSVVDLGVSKISATGEVFNLVEATDLNGGFLTSEAGLTIVGGGSVQAIKNSKNVIMQLKSSQKGLRLTVAPGGMEITLVE